MSHNVFLHYYGCLHPDIIDCSGSIEKIFTHHREFLSGMEIPQGKVEGLFHFYFSLI